MFMHLTYLKIQISQMKDLFPCLVRPMAGITRIQLLLESKASNSQTQQSLLIEIKMYRKNQEGGKLYIRWH